MAVALPLPLKYTIADLHTMIVGVSPLNYSDTCITRVQWYCLNSLTCDSYGHMIDSPPFW